MRQMKTRWAQNFDPEHVLMEYPRPSMVRESYVNLNGTWEYAFTGSHAGRPAQWDGAVIVPYSPEAYLSGVHRQLMPAQSLWYKRTLPECVAPVQGKRWLLHFGAVDQFARVFVNKTLAVEHLGGYLPFQADVTGLLREQQNELIVQVRDYSDKFYYSRGKQKLKRGGMFYTAQSGIWQTVWMEQVPEHYIEGLKITPLYDESAVRITVQSKSPLQASLKILDEGALIAQAQTGANHPVDIRLANPKSWSPEKPFLYSLEIEMGTDRVRSYFAMRKISVEKDGQGIPRLCLNNRPYFQRGALDQGYWPEGLYTPPCDEAMVYDIRKMKELGFNMLRKHVKIEPERWYYHCDRLGMLVWQDMTSGGRGYKSWYVTYLATLMELMHMRPKDSHYWLCGRADKRGRRQFIREMKETIACLSHHPSIVVWVIFNEGWGQFDARHVTDTARAFDPDRLIDQASGWFDQGGGDIRSIHHYFFPLTIRPERRPAALTEFGGYSFGVKGHRMYQKVYGYRLFQGKEELTRGYRNLIERSILPNVRKGLSATIYTQLCDIEEEVNGILTYDREIVKMDEEEVKRLNQALTLPHTGTPPSFCSERSGQSARV